jgi:hypothetical protein
MIRSGRGPSVIRRNIAFTIVLLGLGMGGVALGSVTAGPTPSAARTVVNVTVLEGKVRTAPTLRLSATRLPAGVITLVVVNKGKTRHGLAITGSGLSPKRTPALAVGKKARITVTLKAGVYRVWDPVQGSARGAKTLTVAAVKAGSNGSAGGSAGGSRSIPPPSGGGTGGSDSTWTTCIDPVTGEDHGPMDHDCDF